MATPDAVNEGWLRVHPKQDIYTSLGDTENIAKEKNITMKEIEVQKTGYKMPSPKHNVIIAIKNSQQMWLLHWPF